MNSIMQSRGHAHHGRGLPSRLMFSLDNRRAQESHLAIADKGGFSLPPSAKFARTPALRLGRIEKMHGVYECREMKPFDSPLNTARAADIAALCRTRPARRWNSDVSCP